LQSIRFICGVILATTVSILGLGPRGEQPPSEPPRPILTTIPALWPDKPLPSTVPATTTTTTTTIPAGLVRVETPCQQWLPLMLEVGWPAETKILERALRIMYRESRCIPTADSGPDHGLFQINRFWSSSGSNPPNWLKAQGIADNHDQLFDPVINVRAALALYTYSTYRNGDGWVPWIFIRQS